MTDINLNVLHPAASERAGRKRDALCVGCESARADELAAGLKALPAASRVERLVAQHGARVAEPEREWPIVELRGDHASDADRPLAHQCQKGAVGVHETEET